MVCSKCVRCNGSVDDDCTLKTTTVIIMGMNVIVMRGKHDIEIALGLPTFVQMSHQSGVSLHHGHQTTEAAEHCENLPPRTASAAHRPRHIYISLLLATSKLQVTFDLRQLL